MVFIMTAGLLLTSFAGCGEEKEQEGEPVETEAPAVTDPPVVTEEPASSGAEKEEDTTPINYLDYTLSEEDIATYDAQLLLCEEMLKNGANSDDMEVAAKTLDELACGLQYQAAIAEVLYYCDMQDEEAVDNYLFSSEVSTEITADFFSFMVDLYESGEYEEYFENSPEIELQYLETYLDETTDLTIRNSEILAEFYELQESEFDEKLGALYSEFINNSNEIAAKNDYASYYDYTSKFGYIRDYGREERELFREYVKKYIIPLYYTAYEQYDEAYSALSREDRRVVSALLSNDYDELETNYVKAYLETLPENAKNGMQYMFEEEAYIIVDSRNALEGAFTTDIGVPFCYFGPGYQDSFTMIHEIGHYYADINISTSWVSYDLCETHSQGNEMLFLGYLGTVLDPQIYEVLEAFKMYYFIDTIVVATIMDEFEETVYNLPGPVEYTTEDFSEIMHQVLRKYGIEDEDEYTGEYMDWIWKNVGISTPVYYLSYATSAMASISLYTLSVENYDAALEAYRIIQEEVDLDKSFMGTLDKAGIASVFEEETYIKLQEMFEEE